MWPRVDSIEHVVLLTLTLLMLLISNSTLATALNGEEALHPQLQWFTNLGGWVNSISWSPDGAKLVVGIGWSEKVGDEWRLHGRIIVFNENGSKLWESRDLGGSVISVSWSPDGTKIAARTWRKEKDVYHSDVIMFDAQGNKLWNMSRYHVTDISWSPDGGKLAVGIEWKDEEGKYHGYLVVFDSASGKEVCRSEDLGGGIESLSWSSDGERIAGVSYPSVLVFNSQCNMLWSMPYPLDSYPNSVAWSPDGKYLAVGTSNNDYIALLAYYSPVVWYSECRDCSSGTIVAVRWSPDGTKIAVEIGDIEYWFPDILDTMIVMFNSSGKELWRTESLGEGFRSFFSWSTWSPDGRYLAIAGGDLNRAIIIDSTSGKEVWRSEDLGYSVRSVAWSLDGEHLAVGLVDGRLLVYSLGSASVSISPGSSRARDVVTATVTRTVTKTVTRTVTIARTVTKTITETVSPTLTITSTRTVTVGGSGAVTVTSTIPITRTVTTTVAETVTRTVGYTATTTSTTTVTSVVTSITTSPVTVTETVTSVVEGSVAYPGYPWLPYLVALAVALVGVANLVRRG